MGNQSSTDALFVLLSNSSEDEVLSLLQSGASINSINKSGVSLLRASLENGLPAVFRYCYVRGAIMLPCLELEQTPLHRSVQLGFYALTLRLASDPRLCKHQLDVQDALGRTALHIAVEISSSDLVALLLKYNARREIRTFELKTPYDLALEHRSDMTEEILEQLTIQDTLAQVIASPDLGKAEELSPVRENGSTQESKENNRLAEEEKATRNALEAILEEHKVTVIKSSELKLLEMISRGSSCLVFKGRWRGTEVAIKQFTLEYSTNEKEMHKFIKELQILSQVRHPNVLLLMGICIDQANLCLVTELLPNYTLFYAIHKNKRKRLSLSERFSISIQIAQALSYLHDNEPPIVHRDLKPENCLLDNNMNVKVADFGLARPSSAFCEEATTVCIGTTRFMAPELFDRHRTEPIGVGVDIWAFGCVLVELFSGKRPWHYISSSKAHTIFYELFHKKPVPVPESVPQEIGEIVRECCRYNPKRRPTAAQILERLETAKAEYISQPL